MNRKKNGWQTVKSDVVHENPWYNIQKDGVKLPNGKYGEYFIVKTGASAFVVPVMDGKIIFVRQYRYVFDKWCIELPGGGVGTNESPKDTAKKELREEIGYISDNIQKVGEFIPFSGIVDEISHVFVARDLEFVGQKLESTEEGAEIIAISIDEIQNKIESGEINDGQTIAALAIAKSYIS